MVSRARSKRPRGTHVPGGEVRTIPDLLVSDRLIVNQKAKIVEVTNQYLIRDDQGEELGYMQQEGQSTFRKVLRFATDVDQFLTHRLALYDTSGSKLLQIVRSRTHRGASLADDRSGDRRGHSPETRRARLQRYRRFRVRSSTSRRCSCDVDLRCGMTLQPELEQRIS